MQTVVVPHSNFSQSRDNRVIGLITLAHGFSHFYQILIPSLFSFFALELGLNYQQLGLIITLFFLASGIGQIVSGFAVDRFGGRTLLLFGMTTMSGAHVLAGATNNFPMLAFSAMLAGIGNSVFHPADFSLLNRLVSAPRLPWAFSFHGIGGNIGYVLSPTFAVAANAAMGWHNALFMSGGAGLLLAIWLAREPALREANREIPAAQKSKPARAQGGLFRPLLNPVIFVAFAFFCVTTFYSTAISAFGPAVFRLHHGLEIASATLLLTCYLIAQTLGMVAGGYVSAGGQSPGQTASRATCAAGILAVLLLYPGLGFSGVAVVLVLMGLCNGMVGPSRDLIVKRAAPKEALGRAYGVVYSGFDVGSTLVPIFYGYLVDRKLTAIVIGCVASSFFLNAVIARWLDLRTGAAAPKRAD